MTDDEVKKLRTIVRTVVVDIENYTADRKNLVARQTVASKLAAWSTLLRQAMEVKDKTG